MLRHGQGRCLLEKSETMSLSHVSSVVLFNFFL